MESTIQLFNFSYSVNDSASSAHGHDATLPDMHALLVMDGPAFQKGIEVIVHAEMRINQPETIYIERLLSVNNDIVVIVSIKSAQNQDRDYVCI